MATEAQIKKVKDDLKSYRRKYLGKQFSELNESDTRFMTNWFLEHILGYTELIEIKTEYRIKSEYADYVIQLNRKRHFVVEVKSISLDLNERHLKQSLMYASNEGIDWILLTNGRQFQLYRVNFGKPVTTTLIYDIDLADADDFKKAHDYIWPLTKKAVEKNELEAFWKRTNALELANLAKLLYSEEVVKRLRNDLKQQTGLYFQLEDIADCLRRLIAEPVELTKPRLRIKKKPVPPTLIDESVS